MIHARKSHTVVASNKEQEYLAGWQRERAELQNFRKRMQEQAVRGQQAALRAILEPLLDLADNFQAMVRHVPPALEQDAWVAGVLHIARQLDGLLADYNVRVIEAMGQPFDPARHEAIEHEQREGVPSGHVVEVVSRGYQLGDEVLRPAKVKIAK